VGAFCTAEANDSGLLKLFAFIMVSGILCAQKIRAARGLDPCGCTCVEPYLSLQSEYSVTFAVMVLFEYLIYDILSTVDYESICRIGFEDGAECGPHQVNIPLDRGPDPWFYSCRD
jgi:hypothetical protein